VKRVEPRIKKNGMELETVKVGMVELGLAANSPFQGHVTHPHAEVVAICDMDIENADNFYQHNNGNTVRLSTTK
tara:strand:+ start:2645 stop:2866 length:222 start_codon:yes stop_codon:yes gene_type:complete